jgi:two-component system chemotaxis response regulator CheY
MRTLIVDDEIVSKSKMQKIMESFSECESAETGMGAIAAYKEALDKGNPFDLITLDIIIPDMDGLRALKKIRDVEKNIKKKGSEQRPVKIMMVTSHSDISLVMRCIKAGCSSYIVKPFTKDTIMQKLKELAFII